MAGRLPDYIIVELKATGLPFDIEQKKSHYLIRLAGKPIIAFPHSGKPKQGLNSRHIKNNISTIKRAAREIKANA